MMAIVGILVAAAIIVGVSALNLPANPTSTVTSRITNFTTSVTTSIETSTKISISNSTTPDGTLAIQLSGSVSLPPGVNQLYIQYSDIEVHTVLSNSSIWLRVAS